MSFAGGMLIALLIDVAIGWPEALSRRIGHPRVWLRAITAAGDVALGRTRNSETGLVVVTCVAVGAVSTLFVLFLPGGWGGTLLTGLLAWPFISARSLDTRVGQVGACLKSGDPAGARVALVALDDRASVIREDGGLARKSLETLAGASVTGVVAPLFWGAFLGLPGVAVYRTLDALASRAGHPDAPAGTATRILDLASLIPAWMTGALIAAAATGVRRTAFRTMLRDAGRHRSPSAGWAAAALAGALGVRFSGEARLDASGTDAVWLNPVAGDPRPQDIARGLTLYRRAVAFFALILLGAVVF